MTIVWKAYEEVHFSDQYILRWVRRGDEYVNHMTKEMMKDLKAVVRQQADRIAELEKRQELFIKEIKSLEYCLRLEQDANKASKQ